MVFNIQELVPARNLELTEKIGQGIYGEIWKGNWKQRKGSVLAVGIHKLLVKGLIKGQRARIISEINTLSKLHHPNILHVYGACYVGCEVWIITEYFQGINLYELLYSDKPIAWHTKLRLAQQAACGVQALYSSNPTLPCRDFKSFNFWVSPDCSTLKLLGFGFSTVVPVVPGFLIVIESPRWRAPETIMYPPIWSLKSVVYSLGFIFYEIASRQLPFQDIDDERVLLVVRTSTSRPYLPEKCPKDFVNIIKLCWDMDPQNRPTLQQIRQTLETLTRSHNTK